VREAEYKALREAVGSLLDVVEELAVAAECGQKPEQAWVDLVRATVLQHRRELGFER
jgi:hypothetical protein